MTQTNNEREAFEEFEDLLEQLYWEFDAERAKKSRGERDIFKGKLRFIAKKYKAPISQNEHQDSVTNLWEALGKWSAYLASNGEQANLAPPSWLIDAVSSATSPQSLAEHDNEVLSKVISLLEDMNANGKHTLPDYIEAIRALKVTP